MPKLFVILFCVADLDNASQHTSSSDPVSSSNLTSSLDPSFSFHPTSSSDDDLASSIDVASSIDPSPSTDPVPSIDAASSFDPAFSFDSAPLESDHPFDVGNILDGRVKLKDLTNSDLFLLLEKSLHAKTKGSDKPSDHTG